MNDRIKKISPYQKYRSYFLNYHQEHKKGRKYNFCLLCGRVNNNPRYIKVCSLACSKALRKITICGAVRDYGKRKREIRGLVFVEAEEAN